jgi:hypothetical protein
MPNFTYDDMSFELTARALLRINPFLNQRYAHIAEPEARLNAVIDWMKWLAQTEVRGAGYFGTGGFYLSACRRADGRENDLYCIATVQAYAVTDYLAKLEVRIQATRDKVAALAESEV